MKKEVKTTHAVEEKNYVKKRLKIYGQEGIDPG
jgi:hypothetical protein